MSLKIEIYLPSESAERIEAVEDLIIGLGDLLSTTHGNSELNGTEFDLENLNSFIIIRNEEVPAAENFVNTDMYLVIPIESDN